MRKEQFRGIIMGNQQAYYFKVPDFSHRLNQVTLFNLSDAQVKPRNGTDLTINLKSETSQENRDQSEQWREIKNRAISGLNEEKKEDYQAQSDSKLLRSWNLDKLDLERDTTYTQNSQVISLAGLPPLRQRTFSSMGIGQARKIGYLLRSPSLRPQKCEQSPPPMKLPSPMQRVLQTTQIDIDELELSTQYLQAQITVAHIHIQHQSKFILLIKKPKISRMEKRFISLDLTANIKQKKKMTHHLGPFISIRKHKKGIAVFTSQALTHKMGQHCLRTRFWAFQRDAVMSKIAKSTRSKWKDSEAHEHVIEFQFYITNPMKTSTFKRSLNDFYYTLLYFDVDYHHSRAMKMLQSVYNLQYITDHQCKQINSQMNNNLLKGQLLYHFYGDLKFSPSIFDIEHLQSQSDLQILLYLWELQGNKQYSALFNKSLIKQTQSVQNLEKLVFLRNQIAFLQWKELIGMNISSAVGLNQRQVTQTDQKYQLYFRYLEFIVMPTKFYKHREIEEEEGIKEK